MYIELHSLGNVKTTPTVAGEGDATHAGRAGRLTLDAHGRARRLTLDAHVEQEKQHEKLAELQEAVKELLSPVAPSGEQEHIHASHCNLSFK